MKMKSVLIVWALSLAVLMTGCAVGPYGQGKQLAERGEYDRAIEAFYKEISANPQNMEAWRELGAAFYEKGDLAKAEDALEQANGIALDARTNLLLGLISEKKGNVDAAINAYGAALRLDPGGKTANLLQARMDRLISEKIKREVTEALANESEIDTESIPENTIAVANFDGSHLTAETAPIARGLAEFTAIDLAKVSSLRVVDRQKIDVILKELELSASGLTDGTSGPRVGRLLGSRRVVAGTVTSLGEGAIRLDGAIVNSTDGSSVTTRTSEGDLTRLFRMQKEFVFRIIDDLGITLSIEERDAIAEVPTESYLAFLAYCRGLEYQNSGLYGAARHSYEQAAQADPGFSVAASRSQSMAAALSSGGAGADLSSFEVSAMSLSSPLQLSSGLGVRLHQAVINAGGLPNFDMRAVSNRLPKAEDQPVILQEVVITGEFDAN